MNHSNSYKKQEPRQEHLIVVFYIYSKTNGLFYFKNIEHIPYQNISYTSFLRNKES